MFTKITLDLFCLAVVWVMIADLSGFNETYKSILKFIATKGRMHSSDYPGFNLCSLCLTFWSGLFYLGLTHSLTIRTLAVLAMMAFATSLIRSAVLYIYDIIIRLLR